MAGVPGLVDVAIIGAGFAGLGAGRALRRAGFDDFVIFEQADEVGGTWRDNTYPGCACDVPSHLYSYASARNPEWGDTFSGQPEIWNYLRDCVDRFGLRARLRLGHRVQQARWDDGAQLWQIDTCAGPWRARALIAATGPFAEPAWPDIPGLESFRGTMFHSARWRHDHDLTGRRVAVIGTGASAAQFVPEIVAQVGRLTVFQRTPAWVLPRRSRPIGARERAVYRHVPGAQRLVRTALYWGRETWAFGFQHPWAARFAQRASLRHLRSQVSDPGLRTRLTPNYVLGCKRVLLSNDYWRSLDQPHVEVVTDPITQVTSDAVVTADGGRYEVDTIIAGTGFHVTEQPVRHQVRGRGGVPLAQAWSPTMVSYLGTMVHGFPNFFVLLGPNTGLGHSSVMLMVEAQLRQVVKVLRYRRRTGAAEVEPSACAQRRHTARVDRAMSRTVWTTGGCRSWYLDATGRNSTLWPSYVTTFRARLAWLRRGDYVLTPPAVDADGGAGSQGAQVRDGPA